MITGGMLTLARTQRARLFDKTLDIQAPTTVSRPDGSQTQGWQTITGGAAIPCNKYESRRATEESLIAGIATAKMYYDIHADFTRMAALVVTPMYRLLIEGELLEVIGAPRSDSDALTYHIMATGKH